MVDNEQKWLQLWPWLPVITGDSLSDCTFYRWADLLVELTKWWVKYINNDLFFLVTLRYLCWCSCSSYCLCAEGSKHVPSLGGDPREHQHLLLTGEWIYQVLIHTADILNWAASKSSTYINSCCVSSMVLGQRSIVNTHISQISNGKIFG